MVTKKEELTINEDYRADGIYDIANLPNNNNISLESISRPVSLNPTGFSTMNGIMQVNAKDLAIGNVSILETIQSIQERLNLLIPNPKLEKEWAELAELGKKYRELEQYILEKQKTFDILNKQHHGENT